MLYMFMLVSVTFASFQSDWRVKKSNENVVFSCLVGLSQVGSHSSCYGPADDSFQSCFEGVLMQHVFSLQTLLPAANILQITEVRDACCEFLQSQLHPSNCIGICDFADIHACTELLNYSLTYIEQHFT